MAKKVMIREHDCETGETIDREATPEELMQIEKDESDLKQLKTSEALKSAQKAELLAKLGITEEEAKLLLS